MIKNNKEKINQQFLQTSQNGIVLEEMVQLFKSKIIILMGQNNSQTIQNRTVLVQNWIPHHLDNNLLTNRITKEQIQRHLARIIIKDLPRQTALFASRMNNHQPHLTRLLYFHPAFPDSKYPSETDKEFREMYLYTDRMLPLHQWNRDKIVAMVLGFRKLVSIHGPIKVTERMISQNQNSQIKVWMSQNPVKNHPDAKYNSEEQTVADIASILAKKNLQLTNQLLGCHTLRDVSDKLNRFVRQNNALLPNYSHRASESGDFHYNKKQEGIQKTSNGSYRNVFGQMNEFQKGKEGFLTPKNITKIYENYPQSALGKREEDFKPTSNFNHYERYREYLNSNSSYNIKSTSNIEQKIDTAPNNNKKYILQNSLETKKKQKQEQQYQASKQSQNPPKGQKYKRCNTKTTDILHQTNSYHNLESAKQISPPLYKFERTNIPNNSYKPSGAPYKGSKAGWPSFQNNSFSGLKNDETTPGNSFCGASSNVNKQQRKNGFDITIINNNVNNYISNIVHNHVITVQKQKKSGQSFQFRQPKTYQTNNSSITVKSTNKLHNMNSNQSNPIKNKEKIPFVPVFIQQKKKPSNNWSQQSSPLQYKCKSNNQLLRKQSVNSNNQDSQNQQYPNEIIHKKEEVLSFCHKLPEKRTDKQQNLIKNPNSKNNKFSSNPFVMNQNYPKTPPPPSTVTYQHYSAFQKGVVNANFQVKSPLRTKTTQFYQKGREALNKGDQYIQNKSFTLNESNIQNQPTKEKNNNDDLAVKRLFEEMIESKPKLQLQAFQGKKQENFEEKPIEQKKNLKKQLRNQFKFLLGGDPPAQQEPPAEPKIVKVNSNIVQYKEGRQGEVKQKIIKKQKAFAQLKKEALKVLIDDQ